MHNPKVKVDTNLGSFVLELYEKKAPLTVKNFLHYVTDKHYDGTIFHRVMKTFMIQGGGYTADLEQKPTRKPIKNEAANGLSNERGSIAMARTMDIDSATSQFFINVVDNQSLDYRGEAMQDFGYCVFGKVVEGMDVIEAIRKVRVQPQDMHQHMPIEPIIITSAQVV
jgi:peptidyl-prolyl cis-trans isomerase B (cyclophilin B)